MRRVPGLLTALPKAWESLWQTKLADGRLRLIRHTDAYDPADIDYVLSFRPPPGLLARLTHLKAAFSMGAGVDGFLAGGAYPAHVPLFRFRDPTLTQEMAQYVLLYALMHHRGVAGLAEGQQLQQWRQGMLPRRTEETRVGILGLGVIGSYTAQSFARLGFAVSGWSQSHKSIAGVESYAGAAEREAFLRVSDILVCLLPLTADTRGILNAKAFAAMPEGALVMNVARGAHLVAEDLIAALDSGHLAGAVLDVFETEPLPQDSPLWSHPKVTVTPHVASISQPVVAADYVWAGIEALEQGITPDGQVDITRGY